MPTSPDPTRVRWTNPSTGARLYLHREGDDFWWDEEGGEHAFPTRREAQAFCDLRVRVPHGLVEARP